MKVSRTTVLLLALLIVGILLRAPAGAVPGMSGQVITVPEDEVGWGELGTYYGANLSVNTSHFHRETIYFPIEIPLWFWSLIAVSGALILAFSFLWRGAVNVTVISGWVAFLLVEVAQWTAFMVRDNLISVDFLSVVESNLNITIWSVVHPAVVATDYMVLFWGMFPLTIISILNVIALGLELGWPGLRYFRAGVMRKP